MRIVRSVSVHTALKSAVSVSTGWSRVFSKVQCYHKCYHKGRKGEKMSVFVPVQKPSSFFHTRNNQNCNAFFGQIYFTIFEAKQISLLNEETPLSDLFFQDRGEGDWVYFETDTMSPHVVVKIYVQTHFSFGQYIPIATYWSSTIGSWYDEKTQP